MIPAGVHDFCRPAIGNPDIVHPADPAFEAKAQRLAPIST